MDSKHPRQSYDVVVVGARVAGAAVAMLLAEAGLRVLVFDKGRYGADTVSTHALMRPAVLLLDRWGVLDALRQAATPPVRKTTFIYSDDAQREVIEVDIKPRHGIEALYAPRRNVLDRLLVDAARRAGADVRHGWRFLEPLRAGGGVRGVVLEDAHGLRHEVRADLVIGADGRHSPVARAVGASAYVTGHHGTATAYGYFRGLAVDGYRWCFRPGTGSGAIPTNGGETLVFASVPRAEAAASPGALRKRFVEELARSAPDLAAAVRGAQLTGKLWSFPGMRGFLRQPWGDGWALVGDAGYMSDPITAHGITNALRDADLLAHTILSGSPLTRYQSIRDDLSQTYFEVSDRIASYTWDIPAVKEYHRTMSREMNREEEHLVELHSDPVPRVSGAETRRDGSLSGSDRWTPETRSSGQLLSPRA